MLQVSGMGGNKQEDSASKTFRLERCQVSTVAKGLVALIRSTLLEACSEQVSRTRQIDLSMTWFYHVVFSVGYKKQCKTLSGFSMTRFSIFVFLHRCSIYRSGHSTLCVPWLPVSASASVSLSVLVCLCLYAFLYLLSVSVSLSLVCLCLCLLSLPPLCTCGFGFIS